MSKKTKGVILVVLGLVMVIAATLMYSTYERRDLLAGQNAEKLLFQLSQDIEKQPAHTVPLPIPTQTPSAEADEEEPGLPEPIVYPEMDTADYYGLSTIGIIRVPDCGIELPVLSEWNYTILEYAPCRYSGNIYAGDLIIMGHNYWSHFKPLKNIDPGAEVEFVDVNGTVWRYTVDEIDSVHRNDVELLPSEHDLILFTCEEYGVYRFVARCTLTGVSYPEN